MKTYPEEELVLMLKSGDEGGFHYLYDKYSSALYGMITRNITSEETATDLLQELFIKIYRNISQYDPSRGRLYTWMANIARNLCTDHLRSGASRHQGQEQSLEQSESQLHTYHSEQPDTSAVGLKTIVQKLPESQAEVLDLVYFQGYTQLEASEQLGLPLGTVKTRVRMGIQTLRGIYQTEML